MKLDKKTLCIVVSVLLNLLGGLGIIEPLTGTPDCSQAPAPSPAR